MVRLEIIDKINTNHVPSELSQTWSVYNIMSLKVYQQSDRVGTHPDSYPSAGNFYQLSVLVRGFY